jgi:uncharacterized protein YneF (UPF0154 family)
MDALIVIAVVLGAGFIAGFVIRDREERRRHPPVTRKLNVS